MRIALFSSILGKPGGPAIFDRKLLATLAELDRDNEYSVLTLNREAAREVPANMEVREVVPGGKWLGTAVGVTAELLRSRPDLLHATFVPPPITPCRLVFTMTCWSQFSHPHFYPPLVRWRLRFLTGRGVRDAKAVCCYSLYLKEMIMERFGISGESIFVTPPGVGVDLKRCADKEKVRTFLHRFGIERPYILFIGQLTRRKNVHTLVRAFHQLKQQEKWPHLLVLTGESSFYSREIFDIVRELDLEQEVVFTGRAGHDDLHLLYTGAEVFAFPTLAEGFGLPPLEAMACGTPVVASRAGSVPEVLGEAALFFDPERPEEIAEALHQCLSDERQRSEMTRKGLLQAASFTWENAARRTLAAYAHALEGGR